VRKEPAVEAYLEEAMSWDLDRTRALRSQARRAWWVAGIACGTAVLAVGALWALTPLKQVVPFVVRVDNTTGVVDVVPALEGPAAMSETVTRYLLTHYVTVCERFNLATAESDYAECGAFHTPALNAAWAAKWARGNPQSPLNRYQDGTELSVSVRAVSFLERAHGRPDLAQVRYSILRSAGGGATAEVTQWIVTIPYAYVAPSSDPAVRRWNPLGLRLLAFHPEREVPAPAAPAGGSPAGGTLAGEVP
jgi:type IV secretion system protein VirB8